MPRPNDELPEVVEADARQDLEIMHRGDSVLDLFTDEENGIMAMFQAIRDALFPPDEGRGPGGENKEECLDESHDKSLSNKKKQEKRMPAWQADIVDQFLRAWHHVEVSSAAKMLVTDDDYSVLTIFREVGTETFDELSLGSRRLSKSVLANMRVAVETAQRISKRAALLTASALVPEAPQNRSVEPTGDVTMIGMFKAEEWS